MNKNEIKAENVGPIESLSFGLKSHGVTVLTAPNGSGKSILIDAMQKASAKNGKVPVRDGQKKGSLSAFGATVSIGASTRYKGEFEVLSLEGRCDLSTLVDPKIKDPEAADRNRIKALVGLTGVAADISLFSSRPEFVNFDAVVDSEIDTDDLPEMAGIIKRAYEREARECEDSAIRFEGVAQGIRERLEGVDLTAGIDIESARAKHAESLAEVERMKQVRASHIEQEARREKCRAELAAIRGEYAGDSSDAALANLRLATKAREKADAVVADLEAKLVEARNKRQSMLEAELAAGNAHEAAKRHEVQVSRLSEIIEQPSECAVSDDDIAAAIEKVSDADAEYTQARDLEKHRLEADKLKEAEQAAKESRDESEAMRKAAKSTDEVISSAIKCDALEVATVAGKTRLVTTHKKRGKGTLYSDLSEGERWKIAIDLGVDQVGEDGLLVISQEAWEPLDIFNRKMVDAHARERKVYILTAEATSVEEDGTEFKAKEFANAP